MAARRDRLSNAAPPIARHPAPRRPCRYAEWIDLLALDACKDDARLASTLALGNDALRLHLALRPVAFVQSATDRAVWARVLRCLDEYAQRVSSRGEAAHAQAYDALLEEGGELVG